MVIYIYILYKQATSDHLPSPLLLAKLNVESLDELVVPLSQARPFPEETNRCIFCRRPWGMSLDNGKKNKTMDNQYKLFGLKPQFTPASSLTAPTANQSTQPVCSVCVAQICILENHKTTAQNQQKKNRTGWWFEPLWKIISQLGWLFQYMGK